MQWVILKAIFALLILPFFLTQYLDSAKSTQGNRFARYCYKNWWTAILVVSLALACWVEAVAYAGDRPTNTDKPLRFLQSHDYENEIKAKTSEEVLPAALRESLVRKFNQAMYAVDKNDFAVAVELFLELEAGKDEVGSLPKVESYVVLNNLACAYFKKQRNREFRAASYILRSVVAAGDTNRKIIDQNLKSMDEMSNGLD